MTAPLLSVIIPVYNEVRTIREVVAAVRAVDIPLEIIVVDGNSNDGTVEILTEEQERGGLLVIFQTNRNGRGGALIEGLNHVSGEIVVFQDADLELDPACFPELIRPITSGHADIVFGSRFLRGRPRMTFLQYWGNRVITGTTNLFWNTRLTDAETCYQMFRRDLVRSMQFDRTDMSFTIELTYRLIQSGARIVDVPVDYTPRGHDEGKKLYWGDGFIALWVIIHYRFFDKDRLH